MGKLRGYLMPLAVWFSLAVVYAQGAPSAWAAESFKVGFIDAQKVLESTERGKKARADLQEYVQSREKLLEIDRQDIRKMEEELAKQEALLSEESRRKKQQEYQLKAERFQRRALEMNREIQEKQLELVRDFRKELEIVVQDIAKKEGYDLILDRDIDAGPILFAREQYDLTPRIIQAMDSPAE